LRPAYLLGIFQFARHHRAADRTIAMTEGRRPRPAAQARGSSFRCVAKGQHRRRPPLESLPTKSSARTAYRPKILLGASSGKMCRTAFGMLRHDGPPGSLNRFEEIARGFFPALAFERGGPHQPAVRLPPQTFGGSMKSRLSSTIWDAGPGSMDWCCSACSGSPTNARGACRTERPCWILARCPAALAGRLVFALFLVLGRHSCSSPGRLNSSFVRPGARYSRSFSERFCHRRPLVRARGGQLQ